MNAFCRPDSPVIKATYPMTPTKPGEFVDQNSFLITDNASASAETADSSPCSVKDQTPSLDNLKIGRTIGSGASCKVKIAKDNEGNKYAMKILNGRKRFRRFIEAETDALSQIKHPNIVNMIENLIYKNKIVSNLNITK